MSNDSAAAVNEDPFWSVVRRRHPDLDIVVLPPDAPPVLGSGLPERDPEPFAERVMVDAEHCWAQLTGHGMPVHAFRWIPGPTSDSVRRTVMLTLDDVSETAGIGHLREARPLLVADGWHAFTPPTGTPRIVADRPGELGAEELLFGYSPETGRLFLRLTSTGLTVGSRRATELIGSSS